MAFVPENMYDSFTALPVQIFNWAGRPQEDFHGLASAGSLVLIGVLGLMNLTAVLIRYKYQR